MILTKKRLTSMLANPLNIYIYFVLNEHNIKKGLRIIDPLPSA